MRRLSDTIARLSAAAESMAAHAPAASGLTRLSTLTDFGSNPGALGAHVHIPAGLRPGAPLVVVLHGCTQTAAGYDRASGWSTLADEQGFALLYPEQQRGNNPNGCFNWFEPADTRRDAGEAQSIRQMIAAVTARHGIDRDRIFITGLSAGGAMSATMLAAYPEVFAGGAIIAGLPHGTASGVMQAMDRMRGHRLPDERALHDALRDASDHEGHWPRISIWHGSADATVSVSNAEAILAQWRGVHRLPDRPAVTDLVDGVPHRAWHGVGERVLVEDYIIPGMAHGTPIRTKGADAYGSSAPYMLDGDISSTWRIAQFFGIAGAAEAVIDPQPVMMDEPNTLPARPMPRRLHGRRIEPAPARDSAGVGRMIEDALRAAGLMK